MEQPKGATMRGEGNFRRLQSSTKLLQWRDVCPTDGRVYLRGQFAEKVEI